MNWLLVLELRLAHVSIRVRNILAVEFNLKQLKLLRRLPIVQGSSGSFIPPITAMMTTEQWKCPAGNLYKIILINI